MPIKTRLKYDKIPQLWVICIVLIYSLVMAEFCNTLSNKIFYTQPNFSSNTILSYIMTFNYVLMIVISFVVWIVTSFLFHLFAMLFGGNAQYKHFKKLTGLSYFISAIFFLIAIFMVENVEITDNNNISNLFQTDRTLIIVSWLVNIGGFAYYLIIIPIIKYLYNINWLKSIGAIAIPTGSIYLLGQFFARFIL